MSSLITVLPGLDAHCSGALWLPASGTAIIADLHLGYSWAQRRRGELGPLADESTREKLLAVVDELRPKRLLFLGDIVHAPRPCGPEREWIEDLLKQLSERAELIAVRGNHDRAFHREFPNAPLRMLERWEEDQLIAVHGDKLPTSIEADRVLIAGHLHPALPVKDAAGAGQKLPVFLATRRFLLMPAFSPFAAGYDLLGGVPEDLENLFGAEEILAYAASPRRVVALGPLKRALQKMLDADTPNRFRRRA